MVISCVPNVQKYAKWIDGTDDRLLREIEELSDDVCAIKDPDLSDTDANMSSTNVCLVGYLAI